MSSVVFSHVLIIISQCIIVALLLLALYRLRTVFGLALFYVTLGLFKYLHFFLTKSFSMELLPGLRISLGSSVLFTGILFSILLIYIREDSREARKVIYALIGANFVFAIIQIFIKFGFGIQGIENHYNLPDSFFTINLRVFFTGTLLIFFDSFLIIYLYELISRFISFLFLRIFFSMSAVLGLHALFFSVGAFAGTFKFQYVLLSGAISKILPVITFSFLFWFYLVYIERRLELILDAKSNFKDVFDLLTYRQKYEKVFKEKEKQGLELQKSDEYNRLLFNTSPVGIALMKLDGTLVDINPSFAKILGRTIEETLKFNYCELIAKKLRYLDSEKQGEIGNLKIGESVENEFIHENGNNVAVLIHKVILYRDGEKFVLCSVQDITSRKIIENDLKKHRENLERLIDERTGELKAKSNELLKINEELETFSYSVSHDLIAPLRSIDGFSEILINKYSEDLDEKAINYLNRIQGSSSRMAKLIEGLLNFSRVNKLSINLVESNFSDIVHSILQEFKLNDKDRIVNFKIENNIIAQADPVLIRTVFQNLLGNSWKYTSKKPSTLIEFGELKKNNSRVFFVKDNGTGFDMRYADKLFIPFNRLHDEKEFEGTGIGLATVYRIINRHKGKIWAEGKLNKGATFYFTLQQ